MLQLFGTTPQANKKIGYPSGTVSEKSRYVRRLSTSEKFGQHQQGNPTHHFNMVAVGKNWSHVENPFGAVPFLEMKDKLYRVVRL